MLRITLDRHHVNRLWLVRVYVDRKSEIARQISANLLPGTTGVVAAHHVPVFLHEQCVGMRRMQCNAMHAMAYFRIRVRNVLRMQPVINWFPVFSAIIGAKRPGSRDRDGNSLRIVRMEKNRVQTHTARARLPFRTSVAAAQYREFMPRFSAFSRFKQRGILHACVNVIGIIKRWFQMPDTLEFPRMLRAIIPLVSRERFPGFRRTVVNEVVTLALWHAVRTFQLLGTAARCVPGFAAIIGTLNDLPKPSARLRCVNPIGIHRRTFHMVNFPTREMRAAELPPFTRAIRSQDERALSCA